MGDGDNLGLNEHHKDILMNYMKFTRHLRIQNIKTIELAFKDIIEARILEDTYTSEEIKEILESLTLLIKSEVEAELINYNHTNILLLKQIFNQAQKWHLRMQLDLSELQNKEQLELIKHFENQQFDTIKLETQTPKLAPIQDESGSTYLLNLEISRLKKANEDLEKSFEEAEEKADIYLQEIGRMDKELEITKKELSNLESLLSKKTDTSNLKEVEDELSQVRNLLTTNLELSVKNQQQLEIELESKQNKIQAVNAQLVLAEKELEKKFSETSTYLNMKKMLSQKNEQIKDLRAKLKDFIEEGKSDVEASD